MSTNTQRGLLRGKGLAQGVTRVCSYCVRGCTSCFVTSPPLPPWHKSWGVQAGAWVSNMSLMLKGACTQTYTKGRGTAQSKRHVWPSCHHKFRSLFLSHTQTHAHTLIHTHIHTNIHTHARMYTHPLPAPGKFQDKATSNVWVSTSSLSASHGTTSWRQ